MSFHSHGYDRLRSLLQQLAKIILIIHNQRSYQYTDKIA